MRFPLPLTTDEKEAIDSVSCTSKMPGISWSISASLCITGSKLARVPGTVCKKCYARRSNYLWPTTVEAHRRRLEKISRNPRKWIHGMVSVINHHVEFGGSNYFRWFDSGDLQGLWMLDAINQVAKRTPKVSHWLPTKEKKMLEKAFLQHFRPAPNLTIRLSNPVIDGDIGNTELYAKRMGVQMASVHQTTVPDAYVCPADKQGNMCGSCRACWDSSTFHVSYPLKKMGRKKK